MRDSQWQIVGVSWSEGRSVGLGNGEGCPGGTESPISKGIQTGWVSHSLARTLETMLDAGLWMTAGCNDSF